MMKFYLKPTGDVIMKNILIDINILLDYYENDRREKFPNSVKAFDILKNKDFAFISSSSLDNIASLKYNALSMAYPSLNKEEKLKIVKEMIQEILSYFKIAKTPSYVEIDYDNIEGSLIIASAKAINGKVLTRDEYMLKKYPEYTISPETFLKETENVTSNIPMLDLTKETYYMYPFIEKAIDKVINKSNYILGEEVKLLEEKLSEYLKTKYAIGVASGTDALVLSLRALAILKKNQEYWDREDLIITTPFTFTATGDSILKAGATPLFVDIDLNTYNINPELIEKAIKQFGNKIKGIIPVHLYGLPCNMDEIVKIAKEYDLFIVEDCAQSFGAKWDDKPTGSFGDAGCFSFFPSKNLGGFGDGGAVITNDEKLAELIRMLRVHGGKDKYNVDHIGYKARLDTIQAAVLLEKINFIDEFTEKRRKIANIYNEGLKNISWLKLPTQIEKSFPIYHQYTIRLINKSREDLQKALKEKGIATMVYYPVPLHKMNVFRNNRMETLGTLESSEIASKNVISLPMEPLMEEDKVWQIIQNIKEFDG